MSETTSRVMSWTLDLSLNVPKTKVKTKPSIRLDTGYYMKTLVFDIQGPEHPRTTYWTLEEFNALTRRLKKRLLKKSNIIVPADKMTEIVKAYPREVGYRKCHTHISSKIATSTLEDYSRFINLNIKKGQLKVHIGDTSEEEDKIEGRARAIVDHIKSEGYDVLAAKISPTRGPSKSMTHILK